MAAGSRERMALLELSKAGANLVEFTEFMAEKLEEDQEMRWVGSMGKTRQKILVPEEFWDILVCFMMFFSKRVL